MRKIFCTVISLLLSLFLVFPALATEMDLAEADSKTLELLAEEVRSGTRVFDQTGILSEDQAQELQKRLSSLEQKYGQTMAIVLVNNQAWGADLQTYCDQIYTGGDLGEAHNGDGVLLVLDLGDKDHRGVQIYAKDGAQRYMTDVAIDQAFDSYDGGMYSLLQNGEYYNALLLYTDFLDALYSQGIQKDQYNYSAETGEIDYAYPRHSVKLWHVIVAALIGGIAGFIPVNNVKRKYALVQEKKQAAAVNLAYRADAVLAFASRADQLLGKHVVHVPIPRSESTRSDGGGHSLGGGRSTTHSSMGGGSFTSGGRKF